MTSRPPASLWLRWVPRLAALGLVLGLYVLSCFLPVGHGQISGPVVTIRGSEAFCGVFYLLIDGPDGTEAGRGYWSFWLFGVLPNPLLWIGLLLLLLGRWRLAAATGPGGRRGPDLDVRPEQRETGPRRPARRLLLLADEHGGAGRHRHDLSSSAHAQQPHRSLLVCQCI